MDATTQVEPCAFHLLPSQLSLRAGLPVQPHFLLVQQTLELCVGPSIPGTHSSQLLQPDALNPSTCHPFPPLWNHSQLGFSLYVFENMWHLSSFLNVFHISSFPCFASQCVSPCTLYPQCKFNHLTHTLLRLFVVIYVHVSLYVLCQIPWSQSFSFELFDMGAGKHLSSGRGVILISSPTDQLLIH